MDFSQLSYRELQAHAKEHGIPANKKKEELIRLLSEISQPQSTEECDADEQEIDEETLSTLNSIIAEVKDTNEELESICNDIDCLKLQGVATPQGKKTIFEDSNEDSSAAYSCNWRLSNILEPQNCKDEVKDVRFMSPPKKVKEQSRTSILTNVNTPSKQLLQSVEKSAKKDILMNFWLSKGVTPKKLADSYSTNNNIEI